MWLLSLDLGGSFIALTPFAAEQMKGLNLRHVSDQSHRKILKMLGLTHERGLTQGDIKSPLGWILVFDILITALNDCNREKYPKAPISGIHHYTLTPTVFLDDLTSLTCTREHTQELAELISAFNCIMGTKFHPSKFRAMSTAANNTPVIVYDWRWVPTAINLEGSKANAKILGIGLNLGYTWEEQANSIMAEVRGIARIFRPSRASPMTKAAVLVSSTMAQLNYSTSLSAWPTEILAKLKQLVSRLLRETLRLPATYAEHLLYCTTNGLGLPDLMKEALKSRNRILSRGVFGSFPACAAARGMIERGFPRERDAPEVKGTDYAALERPPKFAYITPLIEALKGRRTLMKRAHPTRPNRMGFYGRG